MIERKIKELSISLEALSRIQGYMASTHFDNVSDLLAEAIKEAKEGPAALVYHPPAPPNLDDDIPF